MRKHGGTNYISAVVRNSAVVPGGHFNFGHLFLTSSKQNYRQQFRADNYKIPCQRKALPVGRNIPVVLKSFKVMTSIINSIRFFLLTFAITISCNAALSQSHNLNAINKIVSIKDYYAGKIPLNIIKSATQLDIKPPYKLLSATVYFSNTVGTSCVTTVTISGNIFEKEGLLPYWSRLSTTSLITFENIKVLKEGKESNLAAASFIIMPD